MNTQNTKTIEGQVDDTTDLSVQAPAVRARRLPEKATGAFRTISEVADELGVQQHVLRFWETKFTQVKPLKRGGGRRYYRPEDVLLIRKIHHLLYTEGYTIKGVQKLLKEQGRKNLVAEEAVTVAEEEVLAVAQAAVAVQSVQAATKRALDSNQKIMLESMLGELKELRAMLKDAE